MIEALLLGWALPSTIVLILWCTQIKREGLDLRDIPADYKHGVIILGILWPLGAYLYIRFLLDEDNDDAPK